MAIELCSESPGFGMSPRISFSHDFIDSVSVQQQLQNLQLNPDSSVFEQTHDFDFNIGQSFELESSTADELFLDGKILPTEIKKKVTPQKPNNQTQNHTVPNAEQETDSGSSRIVDNSKDLKENLKSETEEKQSGKTSFWRFKRSSSLNCGIGYKASLCPIPLLSRSNSTGSEGKRSKFSKSNLQKQPLISPLKPQQSSFSSSSSVSSLYNKPPLKKKYGSYGNVVPVLNVPSGSMFGLSSILFKDKNKKK
ncbi:hypothetical protein RJ641_006532 [Dillenia turbinata]|uniref:Uncharacterized protein n=1 Tax=Dillenia turbinata TaxID=194707 RepID=A0AAN8VDN0_9MAGN